MDALPAQTTKQHGAGTLRGRGSSPGSRLQVSACTPTGSLEHLPAVLHAPCTWPSRLGCLHHGRMPVRRWAQIRQSSPGCAAGAGVQEKKPSSCAAALPSACRMPALASLGSCTKVYVAPRAPALVLYPRQKSHGMPGPAGWGGASLGSWDVGCSRALQCLGQGGPSTTTWSRQA